MTSNPEWFERGKAYIYDALVAGKLSPVIDPQRFTLDDIVAAHRYMESNQQNGKIVVTVWGIANLTHPLQSNLADFLDLAFYL